jgi:thioredoxin 1
MLISIENSQDFYEAISKYENVVVDFYADWCGPCKMMEPILLDLSETIKTITFVKINVDTMPSLADAYQIQSVPTIIIFKNKLIRGRNSGFMSKKKIEEFLYSIYA